MTLLVDTLALPDEALAPLRRLRAATLLGIGTAVPDFFLSQDDNARQMARLWNLQGTALDKWQRIVAGSGIEKRHGVLPPEQVVALTTAQRMQAYEEFAPPLAESAARRALDHAGIACKAVTDIVIVSCTGFAAPGLDVALIERLALRATTRRTTIGFMGCFGAINGLRIASGLCAADDRAVVLLVCAELCSLHMRAESDVQNQVASALFADGAAAAVLAGEEASRERTSRCLDASMPASLPPIGRIGGGSSLLLPEGRDWMTWRITDAGFAMTLTREVPVALRRNIAGFVREAGASNDVAFIVHPGGPGVLDAVDSALDLRGERGIECSRDTLQRFGNMSSGTVLFVLEHALRCGHAPPMMLLAFGPGLTIEGIMLEPLLRGET